MSNTKKVEFTKVELEVLEKTLSRVVNTVVKDEFEEVTTYRSKYDYEMSFSEDELEALETVYQMLCNKPKEV
jgi:hypothetical protein